MNPVSAKFIEEVLSYIRYKKVHPSITVELEDHIKCLKESYIEEGLGEEEACQKAILQMGEPASIGRSLDKTHKPKMEWSVLALIVGIIGIGLIALYLAESYAVNEMFRNRFGRQIIWTVLGSIALITTYLMDYRYLDKWSVASYVIGIGILLYAQVFGNRIINGSLAYIAIGPITLDSVGLALPILMLSYVGIVRRLGHTQMKQYLVLTIIALAPILLLMKASFMSALLLGICLLAILSFYITDSKFNGNRGKLLGVIYGGVGVSGFLGLLLVSRQPYRLDRLRTFINPELDPLGAGYQPMQAKIIRENASILGGGGFEAHPIGYLPEPTSDTIFTFILGSMGWLVGGLLIVMIACVIIRMFKSAMKIQEGYGKLVNLSIATLFTLQFIGNIGMNLGVLPLMGVSLPFVSYGGTGMVVNGALIGVFLSVYRKKDIVLLEDFMMEK